MKGPYKYQIPHLNMLLGAFESWGVGKWATVQDVVVRSNIRLDMTEAETLTEYLLADGYIKESLKIKGYNLAQVPGTGMVDVPYGDAGYELTPKGKQLHLDGGYRPAEANARLNTPNTDSTQFENQLLMDEEVLDALTKASAVDEESGLTIEKLMEVTGRNLDTVVMHTKILLRKRMAQVSSANLLSRDFRNVWPNVTGRDVTGDDVAKAVMEEKERNLFPIVVWLGPVILKELEEKKKEDEKFERMIEAMSTPKSTVHIGGDNYGQAAAGNDIHQGQQASSQTLRDGASISPLIQNPATAEKNTIPKRPWLEYVYWSAAVVVALATVWALATGKK